MSEFIHQVFFRYTRGFPIQRGKLRLIQKWWRPLSFGNYDRCCQLRGSDLTVRCDLTQFIQRQIYFMGSYEEPTCRLWTGIASAATTLFDVGANVGIYSLLAARINPMATIHAFEPTPELAARLELNAAMNGLASIVVNPVAVADTSGQAFLHPSRGHAGDNEGMNFVSARLESPRDLPVATVAITDYCAQRQIDAIDGLKIDIEGGEYHALLGARPLLDRHAIAVIFLELVGWAAARGGSSPQQIVDLLAAADYHLYKLRDGRLRPFVFAGQPAQDVIAVAASHEERILRLAQRQ